MIRFRLYFHTPTYVYSDTFEFEDTKSLLSELQKIREGGVIVPVGRDEDEGLVYLLPHTIQKIAIYEMGKDG